MIQADARWASLCAWYRGAGRQLPWRDSPDPWVILVSEVMLQQTQAGRVAGRIGPFLEEFPTPSALARANRRSVLAAWSGLGYNRRAVRLHEAAIVIDREGWPSTARGLRSLPGVGSYTAAAVACFAFGEQIPAVDVNVRRVLSRWIGRVLTPAEATALAAELLPPDEAHHWVQAIMDLGASTCTARKPACHRCPCEPWCTGASVEIASRPQGEFEGSLRQARGAIVRALSATGTVNLADLTGTIDGLRLTDAARALEAEGLIRFDHGIVMVRETLDSGRTDG